MWLRGQTGQCSEALLINLWAGRPSSTARRIGFRQAPPEAPLLPLRNVTPLGQATSKPRRPAGMSGSPAGGRAERRSRSARVCFPRLDLNTQVSGNISALPSFFFSSEANRLLLFNLIWLQSQKAFWGGFLAHGCLAYLETGCVCVR